ncbi:hypothetical protein KAR91_46615 [Candidatus Pacearchaeota archaeon]|nr:hypothetical protein [Candidatus Pacearchaeota archaeon]
MNDANFKNLIEHYADGKEICNCGSAYLTNCGEAILGNGEHVFDHPICRYGCSAAMIDARDYIADRVVEDLNLFKDVTNDQLD